MTGKKKSFRGQLYDELLGEAPKPAKAQSPVQPVTIEPATIEPAVLPDAPPPPEPVRDLRKVTIYLPADLATACKAAAYRRRLSLSAWAEQALRNRLAEDK